MSILVFFLCSFIGIVTFSFQFSKGTDKGFTNGALSLFFAVGMGAFLGWLLNQ